MVFPFVNFIKCVRPVYGKGKGESKEKHLKKYLRVCETPNFEEEKANVKELML